MANKLELEVAKLNFKYLEEERVSREHITMSKFSMGFIQAPTIPSDQFYADRGADFSSIK